MKSVVTLLLFTVLFFSGMNVQAQWADKLALYLPNRVLDILDVFTLNIGVGPTAKAELRATHALQAGAGVGYTAKAMKDTNRQYGVAMQNGWGTYLGSWSAEDIERRPASVFVREFWENKEGVPSPKDPIYENRKGARDYWELGGTLGVGVIEADVSLHPVDIADAVLGFFFIDIKGDDLTFENFK